MMFYFREEYKNWEPTKAKSADGARRSAVRRSAYKGTRLQVAVREGDDMRVVLCRLGTGQWILF
jgi:hypothetical protein